MLNYKAKNTCKKNIFPLTLYLVMVYIQETLWHWYCLMI